MTAKMFVEFSELDTDSRDALKDSQFAFIGKDGTRHLPIHDANHVRAALGRLNQTEVDGKKLTPSQRKGAMAKILAAARAKGVNTSQKEAKDAPALDDDDDDDEPTAMGSASNVDDDEEPDESEDDTRPADEPGMSDVHVDGPMGGAAKKPKPNKLGKIARAAAQWAGVRFASGDGAMIAQCCNDSCGQCQAAGCGCCDDCTMVSANAAEDTNPETADLMPQEGNIHYQHAEGSAHVTFGSESWRYFIPISCAEAPRWIPYLPVPGKFQSPKYGDIDISQERNADFVKKFNDGVYQTQVPVDAEHESKVSGAMGWIKQLRQNSDGSVDAMVDWTPRGRQMLSEDRFKYFSPEWYDNWKDPQTGQQIENVAIGGALTTRPFFKESALRPLVASEAGFLVPGTKTERPDQFRRAEERSKMANEDEAKRFDELQAKATAQATEIEDLKRERDSAKTFAEETATQARTAIERVAALEADNRRRSFTETAREFPGETAKHVSLMEKLSDEDRAAYVDLQTAAAEQLKASALFRPVGVKGDGFAADTAIGQARQLAEATAAAKGVSAEKAMAEAWTPELYDQYMKESGNNG